MTWNHLVGFDMKYQILLDFRTDTPFKEDLHKLKLLTNFGVNLTSFLGGVVNYVSNNS